MSYLYSTGPVENAVSNPSIGLMVKALNNSLNEVNMELRLYRLNGKKMQVSIDAFKVPPLSSVFKSLDVSTLLQFEVQLKVYDTGVLCSIWGLDADANLIAAHRFTQNELVLIGTSPDNLKKSRFANSNASAIKRSFKKVRPHRKKKI